MIQWGLRWNELKFFFSFNKMCINVNGPDNLEVDAILHKIWLFGSENGYDSCIGCVGQYRKENIYMIVMVNDMMAQLVIIQSL